MEAILRELQRASGDMHWRIGRPSHTYEDMKRLKWPKCEKRAEIRTKQPESAGWCGISVLFLPLFQSEPRAFVHQLLNKLEAKRISFDYARGSLASPLYPTSLGPITHHVCQAAVRGAWLHKGQNRRRYRDILHNIHIILEALLPVMSVPAELHCGISIRLHLNSMGHECTGARQHPEVLKKRHGERI